VLGTFGHLGPEHRVDLLIDALARLASDFDFRLVVVGAIDPALGLEETLPVELAERVVLTGRVDDDDFGALLRAVDLGINLRYPTARAASGPLAQMLSVGTPAVIHDLVHQRDIPDPAVLRVRTGSLADERAALEGALRGWLSDAGLRARAAAAATTWGASNVTPDGLVAGYIAAVEQALNGPPVT
jgi:glycosyltransferase involved in cell wall biosynthesis